MHLPLILALVSLLSTSVTIYDVNDILANDQLSARARAIEEMVFKQHKHQTSQPYRTKIRSLYLNLKDKSNPGLRDSVVSGDLPASRLCTMTSQEMASEDRKQADKKISEANFYNSLGSEEMAAETDAFQCSRCKQVSTTITRIALCFDVYLFSVKLGTASNKLAVPMSR